MLNQGKAQGKIKPVHYVAGLWVVSRLYVDQVAFIPRVAKLIWLLTPLTFRPPMTFTLSRLRTVNKFKLLDSQIKNITN